MSTEPHQYPPRVREGAVLRLASALLVPLAELPSSLDRATMLEWLAELGIRPDEGAQRLGPFWVEGVCPGPEPRDEVTVLRRDGDWWVLGYWERGSFRIDHRFGSERDACRWLLYDLVSHHVTSMGSTTRAPHVRDEFRQQLLDALAEATRLVKRGA